MPCPDARLENCVSRSAGCFATVALQPGGVEGAIATGLTPLDDSGACFENWYARQAVAGKQSGGLRYWAGDDFAFGFSAFDSSRPVAQATLSFYRAMFAALESCGGFAPLRIWHYLPALHAAGAAAPYRSFCRARAAALAPPYCAATVIGTGSDHGVFYFLAARRAGRCIDNPRQVSPDRYPVQYADPPPMFARALLHRDGGRSTLYISGTASIVGHRSQHPGNAPAQLGEVAANLEALIAAAAETDSAFAGTQLGDLRRARLYLRRPSDYRSVMEALAARFGTLPGLRVFRGEICRPELLVEVEGMIEHHAGTARS